MHRPSKVGEQLQHAQMNRHCVVDEDRLHHMLVWKHHYLREIQQPLDDRNLEIKRQQKVKMRKTIY